MESRTQNYIILIKNIVTKNNTKRVQAKELKNKLSQLQSKYIKEMYKIKYINYIKNIKFSTLLEKEISLKLSHKNNELIRNNMILELRNKVLKDAIYNINKKLVQTKFINVNIKNNSNNNYFFENFKTKIVLNNLNSTRQKYNKKVEDFSVLKDKHTSNTNYLKKMKSNINSKKETIKVLKKECNNEDKRYKEIINSMTIFNNILDDINYMSDLKDYLLDIDSEYLVRSDSLTPKNKNNISNISVPIGSKKYLSYKEIKRISQIYIPQTDIYIKLEEFYKNNKNGPSALITKIITKFKKLTIEKNILTDKINKLKTEINAKLRINNNLSKLYNNSIKIEKYEHSLSTNNLIANNLENIKIENNRISNNICIIDTVFKDIYLNYNNVNINFINKVNRFNIFLENYGYEEVADQFFLNNIIEKNKYNFSKQKNLYYFELKSCDSTIANLNQNISIKESFVFKYFFKSKYQNNPNYLSILYKKYYDKITIICRNIIHFYFKIKYFKVNKVVISYRIKQKKSKNVLNFKNIFEKSTRKTINNKSRNINNLFKTFKIIKKNQVYSNNTSARLKDVNDVYSFVNNKYGLNNSANKKYKCISKSKKNLNKFKDLFLNFRDLDNRHFYNLNYSENDVNNNTVKKEKYITINFNTFANKSKYNKFNLFISKINNSIKDSNRQLSQKSKKFDYAVRSQEVLKHTTEAQNKFLQYYYKKINK